MRKQKKPHEERKLEDYMEAAENTLALAKVLAARGEISDQDFLEGMAHATNWWITMVRVAVFAGTQFSVLKSPVR